jgi:hypothetical protein
MRKGGAAHSGKTPRRIPQALLTRSGRWAGPPATAGNQTAVQSKRALCSRDDRYGAERCAKRARPFGLPMWVADQNPFRWAESGPVQAATDQHGTSKVAEFPLS